VCHPERRALIVILSEPRRSVATERESKDLCIACLPRWHEGILTVHPVPETICLGPQLRVHPLDANLGSQILCPCPKSTSFFGQSSSAVFVFVCDRQIRLEVSKCRQLSRHLQPVPTSTVDFRASRSLRVVCSGKARLVLKNAFVLTNAINSRLVGDPEVTARNWQRLSVARPPFKLALWAL
jgi:hypothetical protein